ncbi:unnamed protein product [Brassicogethes aeneus]|uniref:Cell division control protein n=1 Tax=Brassicogethes aeneus TaxID=1431903 RepID=A0A9P0B6T2_BRAAE|nr:unnamed protein product [Brassicogethes aeneus]
MTKISTRSSRRLSQLPPEVSANLGEKERSSRTKRQNPKPLIVLSDGSDSEDNQPFLAPKKEKSRASKHQPKVVKEPQTKRTAKRLNQKPIISDESDTEEYQPPSTPRKEKSRLSEAELHELSPVTPPKQRKVANNVFNDENVPHTPSSLFKKLTLTSPKFKNNLNLKENSPVKQQTPNKKSLFRENEPTLYQSARKALHGAYPTKMPGREKEHEELRGFIKGHLREKTSGSLYVSGPPGTGKTASLNLILEEDNIASEFLNVYVNCTAIKSANSIYKRIAKELSIKNIGKAEKDYLQSIENYLKKNHKMILLVLDEIDQLECKNQSILYTIFEWPSRPNSKLILIGIANALDLTDRTLPRLQARCELKPKLMHFAPYTKQQIVEIFTSRLKAAGVLEVFSPVALQMLAGKVAAISGDVRRALDIGRRVIEMVDKNNDDLALKSLENLANDLLETEAKPKTVDLKQVVNVLNNVYSTSQSLTDDQDDSFPLQQKIIICSLLLMLKKAKNKDVTIGRLHEVYRRVCTKRNLLAVDQAEFVGLCSLIETRGIIKVVGKKEPRLHKVNLEWDDEEVANALKDKQLMSMILQDETCLGKF